MIVSSLLLPIKQVFPKSQHSQSAVQAHAHYARAAKLRASMFGQSLNVYYCTRILLSDTVSLGRVLVLPTCNIHAVYMYTD